jgi:hypothetical protein
MGVTPPNRRNGPTPGIRQIHGAPVAQVHVVVSFGFNAAFIHIAPAKYSKIDGTSQFGV